MTFDLETYDTNTGAAIMAYHGCEGADLDDACARLTEELRTYPEYAGRADWAARGVPAKPCQGGARGDGEEGEDCAETATTERTIEGVAVALCEDCAAEIDADRAEEAARLDALIEALDGAYDELSEHGDAIDATLARDARIALWRVRELAKARRERR